MRLTEVAVLLDADLPTDRGGLIHPAPGDLATLAGWVAGWADRWGVEAEVRTAVGSGVVDALRTRTRPTLAVVGPALADAAAEAADHTAPAEAAEVAGHPAASEAAAHPPSAVVVVLGGRGPEGTIWGRGVDGVWWGLGHLWAELVWPPSTLAYGPDPAQRVDLRVPAQRHHPRGTAPYTDPRGPADRDDLRDPVQHPDLQVPDRPRGVVVLVHGGFWLPAWGHDLMDELAVRLAERGWVTANVEYRRGVRWPAPGEDVVAAVETVARRQGSLWWGPPLVVVGHSAGAQLGAWAARRSLRRPDLAVWLAGLLDLEGAVELGGGAVRGLIGDLPPRVASPRRWLPLGVPQVVCHGDADRLVPPAQSRVYAAAAQAAGDRVASREVAGGDHFAVLDPELVAETLDAHLD